jgi:HK97 family phage major capsid protein
MERIDEINTRLAAIEGEIEGASGEALTALENEVETLTAERSQIMNDVQARQALRANIAAGRITGNIIEHEEENNMENRTFAIGSVEYREAFLMGLQGRELTAEQRAAVTASAAIPTQTMNKIVGRLELAPIINAVDVTYIPGNVSYPVEGTVAAAAWVAMGTAATDSADTVNAVTLGAYKLIKTVEITADVAAMSVDAFENWLVNRLANKLQRAVAAGIMTGSGSSQATGLSSRAADGTYTKAGITYSDVMAIIAKLPTEYAAGASFVMSRATFFGGVLNIQDTSKHPIVVADAQAPAKFNVLGFPVIIEDAAGTDIYFGDLKEAYKFNFAKAPTVDRDESVAFRTGSTVYRAMALADGKPTGVGIVRYTQAAS